MQFHAPSHSIPSLDALLVCAVDLQVVHGQSLQWAKFCVINRVEFEARCSFHFHASVVVQALCCFLELIAARERERSGSEKRVVW